MSRRLAAVLPTAVSSSANRRLTFGVRGPRHRLRHQLQGLAVFAAGLATTSGALLLLDALADTPHPALEVVVLTAANLVVTLMRFVAMRVWIFRRVPDKLHGLGG